MSIDLMGLVKTALSSDVLDKLGNNLGESPANTQKALQAGVPAIIASMIGKASGGGISSLLSLFNSGAADSGILGNLGSMLGGSGMSNLMSSGGGIVQSLLGDKLGAVANLIGSHAGVSSTSATSLLSLAGPLVMGAIAKHLGPGGVTASSLADLLNSQKHLVASALPAGLGNLVGLPSLAGAASAATHAASSAVAETGSSVSKWLWPVVLGLLILGGIYWFMNRGAEPVKEAAATATTAVTDAAKSAIGVLGEFFGRKLPNGVELNIPKLGIENKLIDYIEDKTKTPDKETWFDFDRLLFDTGKATLQPSSQEQLGNIANILKAYPTVKIRLGGYTDNTGDKAANMALSGERANNVMAELVKLGIDASRMSAKGYGDEHPVADNATEEGRAQNRRISLRLTEK